MKITVEVGSASGRQKPVVTIDVRKLADPQETMRVAVVLPEDSDENAVRELGIAMAIEFARKFSNRSSLTAAKFTASRLPQRSIYRAGP